MSGTIASRSKSQRHVDFFLSKVDAQGAICKFAESMVSAARTNVNTGEVLSAYLAFIRKERAGLMGPVASKSVAPIDALDRREGRLAAILYLSVHRSIEENGLNFDAIVKAVGERPADFKQLLADLDFGFAHDLVAETERRCIADSGFDNIVERGKREFDRTVDRLAPVLHGLRQDGAGSDESDPDVMMMTGVEVVVVLLVVWGLMASHQAVVDKFSKDD